MNLAFFTLSVSFDLVKAPLVGDLAVSLAVRRGKQTDSFSPVCFKFCVEFLSHLSAFAFLRVIVL